MLNHVHGTYAAFKGGTPAQQGFDWDGSQALLQ